MRSNLGIKSTLQNCATEPQEVKFKGMETRDET